MPIGKFTTASMPKMLQDTLPLQKMSCLQPVRHRALPVKIVLGGSLWDQICCIVVLLKVPRSKRSKMHARIILHSEMFTETRAKLGKVCNARCIQDMLRPTWTILKNSASRRAVCVPMPAVLVRLLLAALLKATPYASCTKILC